MMQFAKIFSSFVLCLVISGCGYSKITAGEATREQMLKTACEQLAKNLYWSDYIKIFPIFEPATFRKFADERQKEFKGRKIVSVDVGTVTHLEDGLKAKVELEVKYFNAPFYNVEEKTESYQFHYDRFGEGWVVESYSLN